MQPNNQSNEQEGSRWLRVALLTLTVLGPIINTIVERMRQRSQELQDTALTTQTAARHRLDKMTSASRQLAAEQAQKLQEQARQLQAQALQLRAALNENAEQSLKVAEQMRKVGEKRSREMLKRGEQLTEELSERGSKLVKRGGKITHDLAERSSQLTDEIVERGSKITSGIAKRSSKVARDLAERGEDLLEPVRKRRGNFWAIFGFSVGLSAAVVASYLFMRQRFLQQVAQRDQAIELPQNGYSAAAEKETQARPATTE